MRTPDDSDVAYLIFHFIGRDMIEDAHEPACDFIRRMTDGQDDTVMRFSCIGVFTSQSFKIVAIVGE
jgi:hypothetical protein